ncbi:caspase-3 [Nematostella vectensis]|uniref:caspase-3 n=1 Tax=Nematostella vectensis TaxID=45351 RepID=UPI0020772EF9|nr:caspase-3 [Nematostella vectensis]
MEQKHRNLLRKNRVALARDLEPREVLNYIFQEGVFSERDIETVNSLTTRQAQAERILDILPRRGPRAFPVFCDALYQSEANTHLALILQANISAGTQETEPPKQHKEKLPVKTPVESDSGISDLGTFPTDQPTVKPVDPNATINQSDDDIYKMNRDPHGWCLIINNVRFDADSGLKSRAGSDIDASNLQSLFMSLRYRVKRLNDLTMRQMKKTLFDFAKNNHKNSDSVVVCILSHGLEGRIYGVDGGLLNISDVISMFNGYQAKDLIGKPKLFFLQACRGGDFDHGARMEQIDSPTDVEEKITTEQIIDEIFPEEIDSGFLEKSSLPSEADFLIAYATVPGYVSWRHQEKGSWFIQALVEVFKKDATTEDVLSMLIKVNRKVALEFESFNRKKQMPSPVVMLTKKLFFNGNPGNS